MFKKRWYQAAKGSKKKEKKPSDEEGDFGGQFLGNEEFDSPNPKLPPAAFKGPNAITFQLSGPDKFAVVGRNQKIRSELKKMIGSRHDEESGAFEFDLERKSGVKNALSGLGYDVNDIPPQVLETMKAAVQRAQHFEPVDMSLMPQLLVESLLPFQRTGVEFAIQRGGKALICDDMGLGKTIQGIAIAAYYMAEWPCLILAQASLKRVWSSEFEKWIPGVKHHLHVVESAADFKVAQITIMAYDLAAKMADTLNKHRFQVIVADESHMLKSVTAQRTQHLVPLLRNAKRSILLSGTPVLSRPSELFPQLLALDASIWPTLKGFGLRYCNAHEGLHGWDYSGNNNLIELNAVLSNTIMIRRLKGAVLSDLPPKIRKVVQIEKDPSASLDPIDSDFEHNHSILDRLKTLSEQEVPVEVEVEEAQVDAKIGASKLPKSNKLGKKPFGNMDDEDILSMYREASVVKQHGVRAYIRNLVLEERPSQATPFGPDQIDDPSWNDTKKKSAGGRKFLVFAHHIQMLDAVAGELKALRVPYIRIDGSTSSKDRAAHVKTFQQDDSVRAAVLSITCASTGLTLTASSLVIFAELYWNPGTLMQAEDRVHRLGQTASFVELRYLFCKGTVDDLLWPLIGKKLGIIGSAINGAKEKLSLNGETSKKTKITAINKKPALPFKKQPNQLTLDEDIVLIESDGELDEPKVKKRMKKSASLPSVEVKTEQKPVGKKAITSYFRSVSSLSNVSTESISSNGLIDPIVISDSQESLTPIYTLEKKRVAEFNMEEEGEWRTPPRKRQLDEVSFRRISAPEVFHDEIASNIPSQTPTKEEGLLKSERSEVTTPMVKTTPWSKPNLAKPHLSVTPVRLGFK